MWLNGGVQITVFKDYNLYCHCETKHTEKNKNLTGAEQAQVSDALLAKLQSQQELFLSLTHPGIEQPKPVV